MPRVGLSSFSPDYQPDDRLPVPAAGLMPNYAALLQQDTDAALAANERSRQAVMSSYSSPQAPPGPVVLYSPSRQEAYVNGYTFDPDDSAAALRSQDYLDTEPRTPEEEEDWRTVSPEEYGRLVNDIKHPGLAKIVSKNFLIGARNTQSLAGGLASFLGLEETGKNWIDSASQSLARNQPFMREFSEIRPFSRDHGVLKTVAATVASLAPFILGEIAASVATAGAATGVTALSSAGAGIARIFGRKVVQKKAIDVARKVLANKAITQGKLNYYVRPME